MKNEMINVDKTAGIIIARYHALARKYSAISEISH